MDTISKNSLSLSASTEYVLLGIIADEDPNMLSAEQYDFSIVFVLYDLEQAISLKLSLLVDRVFEIFSRMGTFSDEEYAIEVMAKFFDDNNLSSSNLFDTSPESLTSAPKAYEINTGSLSQQRRSNRPKAASAEKTSTPPIRNNSRPTEHRRTGVRRASKKSARPAAASSGIASASKTRAKRMTKSESRRLTQADGPGIALTGKRKATEVLQVRRTSQN